MVAAQARDHAVHRSGCASCDGGCHVKDWRPHQIETPFGGVALRLPRWLCSRCGGTATGISWPTNCRSTPELDELKAHLSALMTYRVAAGVLAYFCLSRSPRVPKRCVTGHGKAGAWSGKLWHALHVISDDLTGQRNWLVNYAKRYRAGLRVGTSITEGAANFLVNRRMNKSQQMRWSRRGADLLLQVRWAVNNGALGSGFGCVFDRLSQPYQQLEMAA
jgi:hypothetical protein